ncbi:MAG: GvpL/GvpF family gas vesicle protein [Pseudomonadota bacterium]
MKPLQLVAITEQAAWSEACAGLGRAFPAMQTIAEGALVALAFPALNDRNPFTARRSRLGRLVETRRVLEALQVRCPVLPGHATACVAPAESVEVLLRSEGRRLEDRLAALRGASEFQVAVDWDPKAALGAMAGEPALQAAMEAASSGRQGRASAIADHAEARREALRHASVGALSEVAVDLIERAVAGPAAVAAASILIEGDGQARLDAALEQIDGMLPDVLTVRCVGPLPAVSFSAIAISLVPRAEAEAMRLRFGLRDMADVGARLRSSKTAAKLAAAAGDTAGSARLMAEARRAERLAHALQAAGTESDAPVPLLDIVRDDRAQSSAEKLPGRTAA